MKLTKQVVFFLVVSYFLFSYFRRPEMSVFHVMLFGAMLTAGFFCGALQYEHWISGFKTSLKQRVPIVIAAGVLAVVLVFIVNQEHLPPAYQLHAEMAIIGFMAGYSLIMLSLFFPHLRRENREEQSSVTVLSRDDIKNGV